MRSLAGVMAAVSLAALGQPALAQAKPERMFQLVTQPASPCTAPLAETGQPIAFGEVLDDAQRGAMLSALFLTLHNPSGADAWPQKELETAPPCPVARFDASDLVWTISGGAAGLPVRWIRAPGRDDLFFLVPGPGLADARAWDSAGRQGLPASRGAPAYYLIGRMIGVNFLVKAYDGPPSARRLADDVAALLDDGAAPLAVHDPVGDAVSLFVPTESGVQSEIFRPQDILHEDGFAALYFPDGRYFTDGEDGAFLMRGSGFGCGKAYGKFERDVVGVHNPTDYDLELSCRLRSQTGSTTVYVTHRADTSRDKASWDLTIRAYQDDTGVARKLTDPPTGPRSTFQAGRNWIDRDGVVQTVLFLRRGEYVYQINQEHPPEEIQAANEALTALLEQIDLPDARSADGWRARR